MLISIITINRNNKDGLKKTISSVLAQTYGMFEYIIVDGNSTDGSVDVIKDAHSRFAESCLWVSEPDSGIYNAMNKGLNMATGDYVQFLNSGDILANPNVTKLMLSAIAAKDNPPILYGNMIKAFPDGRKLCDKSFSGQKISFFDFYSGTLNHGSAYIRKDLFERYGNYDESLKICSDWKWFMDAIILGGEKAEYTDIDITIFDMTGVSETAHSKDTIKSERRSVLETRINPAILSDYDQYADDIRLMRRIHRHKWAYSIVRFIERVLFKIEK